MKSNKIISKAGKLIALAVSAAVVCISLTACGGDEKAAVNTSAPVSNSVSSELTSKYSNYAESFTDEFGEFVDGDMDVVLKGIGNLNPDNFAEWKEMYDKYNERCGHWFNELSAAEMLCPDDKKEAHKDLETTVATIQKIFEGMEPRVEAAVNGDFSQLTDMADEYDQASHIAHEMWDKVSGPVTE